MVQQQGNGLEQRRQTARREVERLAQQAEELRQNAERWQEYLSSIERAIELEMQLRPDGLGELGQNGHQQLSLTDRLVYFTYVQPNHEATNRVATDWAERDGLYLDHDTARAGVAGTFAHRPNLWRRLRKGHYTLTRAGIQRAEQIAQILQPHIAWP